MGQTTAQARSVAFGIQIHPSSLRNFGNQVVVSLRDEMALCFALYVRLIATTNFSSCFIYFVVILSRYFRPSSIYLGEI